MKKEKESGAEEAPKNTEIKEEETKHETEEAKEGTKEEGEEVGEVKEEEPEEDIYIPQAEYTAVCNADFAPLICNDFVNEFLDKEHGAC